MVNIQTLYLGQLRCESTHGPSSVKLLTDAPKDNMGNGESFSPTDLVATALATCMLTTMGVAAKKAEIDFSGATASVLKEMVADPARRIGKLTVEIKGPATVLDSDRLKLERAAVTCPVHKSLHPSVQVGVVFKWGQ